MDKTYSFQEGEVLLVDKPLNWTSFQVVNKIRYAIRHKLGVKKIKVGHAGTLDPLATGLLIICTGKKTKTIEELMRGDKTYTGIIRLGATTPSFDLETEIDQTFQTTHIDEELLQSVKSSFVGEIQQTPPIFSAKKIDGKRAYEAARKGQDIKMKSTLINVNSFEIEATHFPDIHFEINCSKGTYIRSIAHDFGKALNSGGHLATLRRTNSGEFSVNDAKSVDEWVNIINRL